MWPDVSQCFVIFHAFLRRIGSLMRLAVSWSPRRRIAALVFSGKPRPSSVCFSLLRINTVNRTKFCHLLSPRSWEARRKSYYIFEATTELYTQNILSRSGGTLCNIVSLSYMQSYAVSWVLRTEKLCEFKRFQSTRLCSSLEHPSVASLVWWKQWEMRIHVYRWKQSRYTTLNLIASNHYILW